MTENKKTLMHSVHERVLWSAGPSKRDHMRSIIPDYLRESVLLCRCTPGDHAKHNLSTHIHVLSVAGSPPGITKGSFPCLPQITAQLLIQLTEHPDYLHV